MIVTADIRDNLRIEARREAETLMRWWADRAPDEVNGGFHGEIDAAGQPVAEAPKSIILNTRLLWFFSATAVYLGSDEARALAERAYAYLRDHFLDPDHGGVYWLLDTKGQVIDAKKQGYAQAFAVYALAEYYGATGEPGALTLARHLQRDIEDRFWDPQYRGYVEALSAYWHPIDDPRLSDKDADSPKTMNTHLHILEAYANLHRVAPDDASHHALRRALTIFADRFADDGRHLKLFFGMDWSNHSQAVSYGHDIEAAWLMWEGAEVLSDATLATRIRTLTIGLSRATLEEGFSAKGGLSYEKSFDGHLDPDGEWWGQAEGLVGFVNAWQMTGDEDFLDAAGRLWRYLKDQYGAARGSEWTWYSADAARPPVYAAGMWKCPYHNGRAMIELDRRLK
ncbi:mannose-6-phosphate isomerase [Asticcacaulis biprosthecium C19]|uniref:Cellobiose 2-epimerase n=1 Tax=Asticcacaulis biprosthecium C19 TaxID=715226 RepID=F4QMX3_9CAUL|nr:AGE family epimerase/isomerase [Asticcacaulis biprosthecium]EGF91564.1 mannose-6-phosphate isomerase [Asticcacaulis biprosthecium C19]